MRTCRACSASEAEVEFVKAKPLCKPCSSEYMRDWYRKNCAEHKARAATDRRRRRQERRALIQELKTVPCADCRVEYPYYVMDFDHRRGTKEFEIHDAIDVSEERFMAELEKCDVVCSNCHRERTHGAVAELV